MHIWRKFLDGVNGDKRIYPDGGQKIPWAVVCGWIKGDVEWTTSILLSVCVSQCGFKITRFLTLLPSWYSHHVKPFLNEVVFAGIYFFAATREVINIVRFSVLCYLWEVCWFNRFGNGNLIELSECFVQNFFLGHKLLL